MADQPSVLLISRVHPRVYSSRSYDGEAPYFHLDKNKIVLDICRETVEDHSSESAREKADSSILDELIAQTHSVTNIRGNGDAILIHFQRWIFARWIFVNELREHSFTEIYACCFNIFLFL